MLDGAVRAAVEAAKAGNTTGFSTCAAVPLRILEHATQAAALNELAARWDMMGRVMPMFEAYAGSWPMHLLLAILRLTCSVLNRLVSPAAAMIELRGRVLVTTAGMMLLHHKSGLNLAGAVNTQACTPVVADCDHKLYNDVWGSQSWFTRCVSSVQSSTAWTEFTGKLDATLVACATAAEQLHQQPTADIRAAAPASTPVAPTEDSDMGVYTAAYLTQLSMLQLQLRDPSVLQALLYQVYIAAITVAHVLFAEPSSAAQVVVRLDAAKSWCSSTCARVKQVLELIGSSEQADALAVLAVDELSWRSAKAAKFVSMPTKLQTLAPLPAEAQALAAQPASLPLQHLAWPATPGAVPLPTMRPLMSPDFRVRGKQLRSWVDDYKSETDPRNPFGNPDVKRTDVKWNWLGQRLLAQHDALHCAEPPGAESSFQQYAKSFAKLLDVALGIDQGADGTEAEPDADNTSQASAGEDQAEDAAASTAAPDYASQQFDAANDDSDTEFDDGSGSASASVAEAATEATAESAEGQEDTTAKEAGRSAEQDEEDSTAPAKAGRKRRRE